MAGLAQALAPETPRAAAMDDEVAPNVTPEEQAEYELVMNNAIKLIYPKGVEGGPVSPNILKGLKAGDNRIMSLAVTAVTLVSGLRDSARAAGRAISDEILYHAGADIVAELAEVAEAAKVHDYDEEEVEQAFYSALDMYRTAGSKSGDVDEAALKAGFETIRQADRDGRIGEVLPGIEGRMPMAEKK